MVLHVGPHIAPSVSSVSIVRSPSAGSRFAGAGRLAGGLWPNRAAGALAGAAAGRSGGGTMSANEVPWGGEGVVDS